MSKKVFFVALLSAAISVKALASGIQVSNTEVITSSDGKSAQVKFNVKWDYSWRLEATQEPKNWDAAWLFVKYRTLPGDDWKHAILSATTNHHKAPSNAQMQLGNSICDAASGKADLPVGAFIFRKEAGHGNVAFEEVELRWDFLKNNLTGGEQVEVCVLAVEMVWVPQGAFWAGDLTSTGAFRNNGSNSNALAAVQVSAANPGQMQFFSNAFLNNTGYPNTSNDLRNTSFSSMSAVTPDDNSTGSTNRVLTNIANSTANNGANYKSGINANFPRGFNGFYIMKYEITQGEYLQFLNKNRLAVRDGKFYFPDKHGQNRNGIKLKGGSGATEYELEPEGAAFLPMNWLGTADVMAWLIWAGLRPMTELEFEKATRGITAPNPDNIQPIDRGIYAWGAVALTNAAGLASAGQANEAPASSNANVAVADGGTATAIATGTTNSKLTGPIRSGGFATAVSSRENAGATFYGAMEMSGNLWERAVTVGTNEGRAFQGSHGNGEVGVSTTPQRPMPSTATNTTDWPPFSGTTIGLGFKGGSYLDHQDRARVSDRLYINVVKHDRHQAFGGRGVRSAVGAAFSTP